MKQIVFVALIVAACSSGEQKYLPAIKGLRSAAAEWALVNREAGRGRLTAAYVAGMRQAVRKEIEKDAAELAPGSPAARHASALKELPDDAPPRAIAVHSSALRQIETTLEPA